MSKREKFIAQLLGGASDANIPFANLCQFLISLGFLERVRGSHHIFTRAGVAEIINLQSGTDGRAKTYQVKQVRALLTTYALL
jgi:predicted RNA binding protein YcfA (HicA-like mRNA interferase family)